jgi:CelD/BcsL family acetyltransferase involved in cellulose biosynthesis/ribosomal protein S18 acetylase RimI-like enzyme
MEAVAVPATVPTATAAADTVPVESRAITTLQSLEAALVDGLQAEWQRIVDNDPLASLFQTAGWCMPWYRSYAASFDPYVILISSGGRLVGLVPMAVDRSTRALVFASHTMADYRDIVAVPGYREPVVAELVKHYLAGGFAGTLQIGWIDPASDTPAIVARLCAARRLRHTVHHQPCWRWFPPAPAKPSAQKFLNWYKRHGAVAFEVIDSEPAWARFREEYYRQHTLRQIQAGRQKAFDDTRKAALYEQLFHSPDIQHHVTGFFHNGQMLAGHFGYVWRGVLLLGPPSIRLEEEQRSPAVILLSWIIQNAASLGLKGFDLTIGESDFKKRLGNQCVELSMIEIHASKRGYYAQVARDAVVNGAKGVVERVGGPGSWKSKIKPAAAWLAYKRERLAEMGVAGALRTGTGEVLSRVYERREGLVYAMTPAELRPMEPKLAAGETFEVHDNTVEDLRAWNGSSPNTASLITHCARIYARARHSGRSLHTIVVNGQLAGWGYSYLPTEPAELTETPGASLEVEPGAVSLYDFHVLPEFRGRRLYQALLTDILRRRFAAGASRAYITVLESNTASRTAIERVGFRGVRRNSYRRLFTRQSIVTHPAPALESAAATRDPAR